MFALTLVQFAYALVALDVIGLVVVVFILIGYVRGK